MKTLQQHIYENNFHKSEINEKLIINRDYKRTDIFIYKLDERNQIRIFDGDYQGCMFFKDKVYVNGEKIKFYDPKYPYQTKNVYDPGEYEVYIEDIDKVTNCTLMFRCCYQLIHVPWFDTSKVWNMAGMFCYCENLKEVPLFDTRNTISMSSMFYDCKNLISVPKFDTRNCEDMYDMFNGCEKLIDVPLFDTKKVKLMKNMKNMFSGCSSLSNHTKYQWKHVYDFEKNKKRK